MRFPRIMAALVAAAVAAFAVPTPAAAQELYGTLRKIRDAGVIKVGHRESSVPFSQFDQNRRPAGFSVDLCMRVVDAVKRELNMPNLRVEFIPVNPSTRIPLIANGTVDIECGSTTYTLGRSRQVDFSSIFYLTGTQIMSRQNSGIREVEDLANKSVALVLGTTNERAVKAAIERLRIPNVKVLMVKDHAEALLALETDRVDAYATDEVVLWGLRNQSRIKDQLVITGRLLSYDPYGLMLRRDDSAFRLLINTTLAGIFRSGEIEQMFRKWFEPAGIPINDRLRQIWEYMALPE
ncbi:MAG: amino acid ABC transporter substrate-binding protein [Alphaproteobacteria bacterium]|nr:amino acid ABC transporter substrate-binding protein [Alphaproteobacteria bacterium]